MMMNSTTSLVWNTNKGTRSWTYVQLPITAKYKTRVWNIKKILCVFKQPTLRLSVMNFG